MLFFDFLTVLALGFNIVLGGILLSRNAKNRVNQFYAAFVFSLSLFIVSITLENRPDIIGVDNLDTFLRLDFTSGILFSYTWFLFCLWFTKVNTHLKIFKVSNTVLQICSAVLIALIWFTPYIVTNIVFSDNVLQFEPGLLWILYVIFVLFLMVGGLVRLIYHRYTLRSSDDAVMRRQISFVIFGFLLSLGTITIIFLFLQAIVSISFELLQVGVVSLLLLPIFTAYAIAQHRLFELEVIAAQILVAALSIFAFGRAVIGFQVSTTDFVIDIIMFFAILILGILLIRTTEKQIIQRKKTEYLLDRLRDFVSFATHELRGPVANFKSAVSMIFEGDYGRVPDSMSNLFKRLFLSADTMGQTIDTFLAINKIEVGQFTLNAATNDIIELITSVIEETKYQAELKQVYVHFTGPKKYSLFFDTFKMKHVIRNLLENAIKYNKERGKVWVSFSLEEKQGYATIVVRDTGIGITDEQRPRLFSRYTDIEQSKINGSKIESHGIGLWLVREILELHGGKIKVKSDGRDTGATFYAHLPLDTSTRK